MDPVDFDPIQKFLAFPQEEIKMTFPFDLKTIFCFFGLYIRGVMVLIFSFPGPFGPNNKCIDFGLFCFLSPIGDVMAFDFSSVLFSYKKFNCLFWAYSPSFGQ